MDSESDDVRIRVCRVTLKILQYSLIWPSEKDEMNPGKAYRIRIALFLLITTPWCFSVLMHLINSFKTNAGLHISEDISFLLAFCGIYYNIFIIVKNQSTIAIILRDLSNFKKFGVPPGFESTQKQLNFWSLFMFLYTVFGISVYCGMKLAQKSECERKSTEQGQFENCGFITSVWTPINVNYFPVYQLVFLYIFLSVQMTMKLFLMISYLVLEMAYQIVLRISHLKKLIVDCFEAEGSYEERRKKLTTCFMYHAEILELATRLDNCFSNSMFVHLTMTSAICGCIEKQFVDGDSRLCAIIHAVGWIMALFVACYGGQQLINAGASLPDGIWSSKWYQAECSLRKDLMFMLLRSQKDLYITAGPFGVMSYSLFVSVMKMSYSILCMLTS